MVPPAELVGATNKTMIKIADRPKYRHAIFPSVLAAAKMLATTSVAISKKVEIAKIRSRPPKALIGVSVKRFDSGYLIDGHSVLLGPVPTRYLE
jgi:hypothetical protein